MATQGFRAFYRCHNLLYFPGTARNITDLQAGGKVFLPQSALEALLQQRISYPMHFAIRNRRTGETTHCGVLEFTAREGTCHAPTWMMQQLRLGEGDIVEVAYVPLPLATFLKLQPCTSDFLDITDHRAVLEFVMTNYAAVTVGDVIALHYNKRDYRLAVREVKPLKPHKAVSIVETNVSIEFDPPMDYKPPTKPVSPPQSAAASKSPSPSPAPVGSVSPVPSQSPQSPQSQPQQDEAEFVPFAGRGHRLDGKSTSPARGNKPKPTATPPPRNLDEDLNERDFTPFTGVARRLDGAPVSRTQQQQQQSPPPTEQQQPQQPQQPQQYKPFVAFSGQGHRL